MQAVEPLHDFVVFKLEVDKARGHIVLPEAHAEANRDFRRTRVIAVGPGRVQPDGSRAPMSVRIGDCILVGHDTKYLLSTEITGEKLWLVPESSIVAVLRSDEVTDESDG